MRIPYFLFRHSASIEELTGSGAYGEIYDTPYTVRGYIEFKRRRVLDAEGRECISESRWYMYPDHVPPPGSKLTFETTAYTVIKSARYDNPLHAGDPHHVEVDLI